MAGMGVFRSCGRRDFSEWKEPLGAYRPAVRLFVQNSLRLSVAKWLHPQPARQKTVIF